MQVNHVGHMRSVQGLLLTGLIAMRGAAMNRSAMLVGNSATRSNMHSVGRA